MVIACGMVIFRVFFILMLAVTCLMRISLDYGMIMIVIVFLMLTFLYCVMAISVSFIVAILDYFEWFKCKDCIVWIEL